jgi:hypothetical protein
MRLLPLLLLPACAASSEVRSDLADTDLTLPLEEDAAIAGVDAALGDAARPLDLAQPVDAATAGDLAQGPCPAPAVESGVVQIYGDAVASGWDDYGFQSSFVEEGDLVCSGTKALRYHSGQYDGVAFSTDTQPVAARKLSVRVHVDVASRWTIAAVAPGEADPHQFLGPVMSWPAGWTALELDIPTTTPETRWVLFEKQDPGSAELVVDDLRLY